MNSSHENITSIATSNGPVNVVNSARQVDGNLWPNTLSSRCLDARYYKILEETFPNRFEFHHAILTNAATGATAVQPLFFVQQDITGGLPPRLRLKQNTLKRFLKMKMAVVGCAAGEGELDCAAPWAVEELAQALIVYARENRAGILLFKDFPAEYRGALAALSHHGYMRIPSMPAAVLDLDFSSIDEYMRLKLGAGFRSNLRRKLRDNDKLGTLTLDVVVDASPFLDQLFPLYLQTYERSPFHFEKLPWQYFTELGLRMPDRTRFFLWRQNGRVLAFALCMVHERVMYYLNLGMDYPVALDRHLYFVVWRDLVTWALASGLKKIETGPLNYEAKFRLGLHLAPRDLYARHSSAMLNPFFALALRFLQPVRHDPVLWKFPNARDL